MSLGQALEVSLHDFISTNREEIIKRARAEVASRPAPLATAHELANGVPLFLTQLGVILKQEAAHRPRNESDMEIAATRRGGDLLEQGFSIAQVVHGYGDICQAITELASDLGISVAAEDFHTMNRCLDNAIADAVTEYARRRDVAASGEEVRRQGVFVHELRNHLNVAALAYQVVKSGKVGVSGSTIDVLGRSLQGLRELIDRSMVQVRHASRAHARERLRLAEVIEEMEIDATVVATDRGLQFSAERVDPTLMIEVDRPSFTSAISNLLQNAMKFTRPASHVRLRVRSTPERVSIEIEDECGGLPAGVVEAIFRPFEQRGSDRTGLGLGLAISRTAVEADHGRILARDIPGKGCVFIVEMPLAVDHPRE
jgi:signal transduction histidine kinase